MREIDRGLARLSRSLIGRAFVRLGATAARPVVSRMRFRVAAQGFVIAGRRNQAIYLREFQEGTYEPLTLRLWRTACRQGGTAVDVGANLGYFTLHAAQCVGAQGKVVAFEPNPAVFAQLRENVHANGFDRVVELHPAGASDRPGSLPLYTDPGDPAFATLHRRPGAWKPVTRVPLETLDEALRGRRPDAIKIDVEGHELSVLKGMAGALEVPGSMTAIVECSADTLEAAATTPRDVHDLLRVHRFRVQMIDEPRETLVPFDPSNRDWTRQNLYCTRDR